MPDTLRKIQLLGSVEYSTTTHTFTAVVKCTELETHQQAEELVKIISRQFFDYINAKGGAVRKVRDPALPMVPVITQ